MPTANEIRRQFIDFFVEKHGHTFVPSSPVVPYDDPTLLFANAGMNQFKPYFLGTEKPKHLRVANTQKCIRAGGKHNDLDDVGKDTYHHTFFEMLGNWSFGDYFKAEAIRWAWELLTGVWGLDKSRLHVTVFEGDPDAGVPRDDEAAGLWRSETDIDPSHVHFFGKRDNFWEMGDTGPCGPCSEIHIDRTPGRTGGGLVNKGSADVIEIWNLVFIQYNRNLDRSLTPLPAKHVDTGMGFERVTAVLQDKASNYDTDVFTPILDAVGRLTGKTYGGQLDDLSDVAFRVIADHLRMLVFAINDGALPDNKGRGAVVRSVLRRAFRFGFQYFEQREPFIYKLVPVLNAHMQTAFPELSRNPSHVENVIYAEESDFLRTIQRGFAHFADAIVGAIRPQIELAKRIAPSLRGNVQPQIDAAKAIGSTYREAIVQETEPLLTLAEAFQETFRGPAKAAQIVASKFREAICPIVDQLKANQLRVPNVSGNDVFQLHTTFGFPPDLTRQMAAEIGLSTEDAEYARLMREHEEKSRHRVAEGSLALIAPEGTLPQTNDSQKYKSLKGRGKILLCLRENNVVRVGGLNTGDAASLVLDKTCFYAEQGGQVGDSGTIKTGTGLFRVDETRKMGDGIVHVGQVVEGEIKPKQSATLEVSADRAETMRNHTATHLMNWALRKVLGEHVEQKGSLVDAHKTRFDFAHDGPLTAEQVTEIERLVNDRITADLPVTPVVIPLADAKHIPGVRAVFGEKYPDPVRVLLIGAKKAADATADDPVEFCGGTHLNHTGQAGFFKIISQEAVAKGVRRVTAVTGAEALAMVQRMAGVLDDVAGRLNCRTDEIAGRVEALQDEIKRLQQQLKKGTATDLAGTVDKLLADAPRVNGWPIVVGQVPAAPADAIRAQVDRLRSKAGSCVVIFGWADDGKAGLLVGATDDLVQAGIHAGKLVGEAAQVVDGRGGGQPTLAQAGGKNPAKLGDALALAASLARQALER